MAERVLSCLDSRLNFKARGRVVAMKLDPGLWLDLGDCTTIWSRGLFVIHFRFSPALFSSALTQTIKWCLQCFFFYFFKYIFLMEMTGTFAPMIMSLINDSKWFSSITTDKSPYCHQRAFFIYIYIFFLTVLCYFLRSIADSHHSQFHFHRHTQMICHIITSVVVD